MSIRNKRFIISFLIAGACLIGALICRKHAPGPSFASTFALAGLACVVFCSALPVKALQYVGITLFSLFLALAGGEIYLYLREEAKETAAATALAARIAQLNPESAKTRPAFAPDETFVTCTENGKAVSLVRDDPVTGYRMRPDAAMHMVDVRRGVLIYDVVYTTDKDGWRVVPQNPEATQAVVFFGCSFTFGIGLGDDEVYPWKSAQMLGKDYQVFNFGLPGCGSHQFLALLESGILDAIAARYQKVHVFFLNIPTHELRSAGYAVTVTGQQPWYALENGRLLHKGTFGDRADSLSLKLDKFFRGSYVYALFFKTAHSSNIPAYLDLQNALFKKSAEKVATYPNADFTLLLWPGAEGREAPMRASGIRTLAIAPALPDSQKDMAPYEIPGDGHPNAHANTLMARHVADFIRTLP